MAGEAIFGPFLSMLLLTFVVWVYLYVRRLSFIKSNNIDAQQLTTPQRGGRIIPEAVSYPAYNFQNLFELPVVFYALCLYLYATQGKERLRKAAHEIRAIAIILVGVLAARSTPADHYHVPSGSMEPTLISGDRVFV